MMDQLIIKYKIKDEKKIKLFGKGFIENNKNICKIIINNKEIPLSEYYIIENESQFELELKLIGINNITNISSMFSGCNSLLSIQNIQKWNTSKITDTSELFTFCNELKTLPDISFFDTSNVQNMAGMFRCCESLISLPDISKWNISKEII